jgi:hypothetical protein
MQFSRENSVDDTSETDGTLFESALSSICSVVVSACTEGLWDLSSDSNLARPRGAEGDITVRCLSMRRDCDEVRKLKDDVILSLDRAFVPLGIGGSLCVWTTLTCKLSLLRLSLGTLCEGTDRSIFSPSIRSGAGPERFSSSAFLLAPFDRGMLEPSEGGDLVRFRFTGLDSGNPILNVDFGLALSCTERLRRGRFELSGEIGRNDWLAFAFELTLVGDLGGFGTSLSIGDAGVSRNSGWRVPDALIYSGVRPKPSSSGDAGDSRIGAMLV